MLRIKSSLVCILPGTIFQQKNYQLQDKLKTMFEEYENRKRKQIAGMKSLMDYGMGILILFMGLFFLFRLKLGNIPINERLGKPDMLEKIFGGFCILYGVWRIYRGYQKKYFR